MVWMSDYIEIADEFSHCWQSFDASPTLMGAMAIEMVLWRKLYDVAGVNWPTLFQGSARKLHTCAEKLRKCAELSGR